ncbi:polysaccharide deacetylase family protein [Arthrobacter gandavensis]|uniref:polysaccharide deacetylase family protein n=1 Tax=Arthrobacter gandavensis TaxID=169960 RepID=UPI00188EE924|nr:polysaccharide deacetylase family protein [Arthrobacter gandavensis]MBF4994074.1 polysaccharide deacetylase family protein [Arthrobacter gandavensis]
MGTTRHTPSGGERNTPPRRATRKHKRSLQVFTALIVLALPASFLAFGSAWLADIGLGPSDNRASTVSPAAEATAPPSASASPSAADKAAAEFAAAAAIDVPDYVPSGPMEVAPGQTVVSLTFDDGFSGAGRAAEIMTEFEFPGTFYLNSGLLDDAGSLTVRKAKEMALAGHEIGGHTFSHPDVETIGPEEAQREICQDRQNLLDLGFEVTNFAYPFASSEGVTSLVEACGYNSARGLGGTAGPSCEGCPTAESFQPEEPYLLKAPSQVEWNWTLADLQNRVEAASGGWVILTFHGLCPYQCDSIDIDEELFQEFTEWLSTRTQDGSTVVRTVQQVIGGPKHPAVAAPAPAPAPPGVNALHNADLEQWAGEEPLCWANARFGSNEATSGKATGRNGSTGAGITMHRLDTGDAKLVQRQDLGACAPAVREGERYSLRLWYTSDAPTQFSVYYRDSFGRWTYWLPSPELAPSAAFREAEWTTPPVPAEATALSFGLSLTSEGYLVTDDYGMYSSAGAPPLSDKAISLSRAEDGSPAPTAGQTQ